MDHWIISNDYGQRLWHADSSDHAIEQHEMDFFDEPGEALVQGPFVCDCPEILEEA